jgi:hypothetical protein
VTVQTKCKRPSVNGGPGNQLCRLCRSPAMLRPGIKSSICNAAAEHFGVREFRETVTYFLSSQ